MAIDDKLLVRDVGGMGSINAGDHDERIVRGPWVYYVVADRWLSNMGHARGSGNSLVVGGLVAVILALLQWMLERIRPRPWKVAVHRMGNIGVFNDVRLRRVHLETLPLGTEPYERIAQLVARAEAGEFEPDA